MTQVVIKQSGKRGSGVLIVVAVLAALGIAKYGPRIGRVQDAQERAAERQFQRQQWIERNDLDFEKVRKALKESKSAERLLDSLAQPPPESPPVAAPAE